VCLLGLAQNRWLRKSSDPKTGIPFAIACSCGHVAAGVRGKVHRDVHCPACGQSVFVLPASPWLGINPKRYDPVREFSRRSSMADLRFWRWRMPLIAAALTTGVVVAVFYLVLPRFGEEKVDERPAQLADPQDLIDAGRRSLADGNFFLAEHQFSAAEFPSRNTASASAKELDQLRRQASLLAHLHGRSLQEILSEALPLRNDDEWKERFRAEHLGKALVFDDVVGLDGVGRPMLTVYRVRAGTEKARIALEDLQVLGALPLNPPQRLLFGARLAGLGREQGGAWVFHLEPESGVLLTDRGAAAACAGPLDNDLLDVLHRQQLWVESATRVRGAR